MSGVYNVKRTSLVKLLKSLNYDEIIQTHRSFAVNIKYIT
ncbi:LytTR family transcriptional regulator DNA-binding domain-containing protein [Clostridium sp.]